MMIGGLTIDPWEYRLSMKVGTESVPATVPCVRPTGPKPIMPSTPWNPEAEEAAPKDCCDTAKPEYETGPVFSVPETVPDPYLTEKLLPVLVPQDDETASPAPAYPYPDTHQQPKTRHRLREAHPCVGRASVNNEVEGL